MDLTPEEQQGLARAVLDLVVPWLKNNHWAVWVLVAVLVLVVVSFVIGVASDFIDGSKLTSVRGKAAYALARRLGYFFKGSGKEVRAFVTGVDDSSSLGGKKLNGCWLMANSICKKRALFLSCSSILRSHSASSRSHLPSRR